MVVVRGVLALSSGIWNGSARGEEVREPGGPLSGRCVRTCAWLSAWAAGKGGPVTFSRSGCRKEATRASWGGMGNESSRKAESEGDPASWPAPLLHTGDRVPASHACLILLPGSLALLAQGCLNLRGHRKVTYGRDPLPTEEKKTVSSDWMATE